MAFLARHNGVKSDQRKSRDIMIERRRATPTILPMASLAAIAQLTVMPIIFPMTGYAGGRQLIAVERSGVAGCALYLGMRRSQRKFRRLGVIESDRRPFALVVAAVALGSVPPGVDVLNSVAIRARHANSLVILPGMARGARNGAMRTSQGELGPVVVE